MANTDKDILITPNNGSSSADPKIEFKGADASTSAQTITATAYPTNNGTLSFDGSAGQLFSITNDMTGTIFSVNDVSGIPSIEVDDDGTIRFAEYSGNVLIGTATDDGSKLQVNGSATVSGNVTASNVFVASYIYHEGDTDTSIAFDPDTITLVAGGSSEVTVNSTGVRLGDTGNGYFQPVSGEYGSIQIDGGAHGGWEGYSIGGRVVFMHNNSTTTGIYNDVNNHWLFAADNGGAANLYYNGSNKIQTTNTGVNVTGTLTVNGAAVGGGGTSHSATASGAIANGDPCIVNSDGTVSAVASTTTAPSIGTETQLENFYSIFYRRIAAGGGFVVAIYKRQNSYLQARIGAVSSGSITWSSSVFTVYSANFAYCAISYDESAGRFIISWRDGLNGLRYFRAKSMLVSGTISSLSVSFGTEINNSSATYHSYMDQVYHPTENKTVCVSGASSRVICDIFTCNASNGSLTRTNAGYVDSTYTNTRSNGVCYDSDQDALVFSWRQYSNSQIIARAATLSGTTLTLGTETLVSGSGVGGWMGDNYNVPIASDGSGNILIVWSATSNNYGYATLMTLSGTTLTKQNDTLINGSVSTKNPALSYDETNSNFAVMYADNSSTGKVNTLSISGTTVSVYGTETQFDSGSTGQTDIAYFSDLEGSVMLYQKGGTNYAYSNYYISLSSSTNMTASNYIGISDAAYANAATATIQIVGSVDDAQSGLTAGQTYYIQQDGSLGTVADSPSVIAGTAVSATEIIVKG